MRKFRDVQLFGDLIALHRQDFGEVGKDIGRSKAASTSWTKDLGIFVFQCLIESAGGRSSSVAVTCRRAGINLAIQVWSMLRMSIHGVCNFIERSFSTEDDMAKKAKKAKKPAKAATKKVAKKTSKKKK